MRSRPYNETANVCLKIFTFVKGADVAKLIPSERFSQFNAAKDLPLFYTYLIDFQG